VYSLASVDTQSYVLNFHGRVTQASVKNFQIVHESDGTWPFFFLPVVHVNMVIVICHANVTHVLVNTV